MTACASGCTVRNSHRPTCEGDCRGCLPRDAEHGWVLCLRCHSRLAGALAQAPTLVAHLRTITEPGTMPADDVRESSAPPAPMNLESASDADDLHNALVSWSLLIMEERPARGPDMSGTRWARRSEDDPPVPAGLLRGDPTTPVARFLLAQLDWVCGQDWAPEMVREVARQVATLEHKWPRDMTAEHSDVPCPQCRRLTLTIHPPAGAGWPRLIRCDHLDCGALVSEDTYAAATAETESGLPVEIRVGDSMMEIKRGRVG